MTPQQFKALVALNSDQHLLETCINGPDPPFLFSGEDDLWEEFRNSIANDLGIQFDDIRIVGSARLGFSLKPGAALRSFTQESDIDLVVVNADLFDRFWIGLLKALYPRRPSGGRPEAWFQEARTDVYTGWLRPQAIRLDRRILGQKASEVLGLRAKWFEAMKKASQIPTKHFEDIQSRLYRTWRHADLYHLYSLGELRKSLSGAMQ